MLDPNDIHVCMAVLVWRSYDRLLHTGPQAMGAVCGVAACNAHRVVDCQPYDYDVEEGAHTSSEALRLHAVPLKQHIH